MVYTSQELPRYKCHKEVYAMKIAAVEFFQDGSAQIAPSDEGCFPFMTKPGWSERFKGLLGDIGGELGHSVDLGYFVLYENGYESWSPTEAFEDGYTRID